MFDSTSERSPGGEVKRVLLGEEAAPGLPEHVVPLADPEVLAARFASSRTNRSTVQ